MNGPKIDQNIVNLLFTCFSKNSLISHLFWYKNKEDMMNRVSIVANDNSNEVIVI